MTRLRSIAWLLLVVCGIGTLPACFDSDRPGGVDNKIGQLSVFMQQRYRRELHKDQFEINYVARPPKKILISVRLKPNANRNLIAELVESAKEIIRRKGYELYQLENVEVDVEMKEI